MASSTRIFSFGLGAAPSRSLVKGLARTTNGRFVFIPPNTNIDVYVGEQLQRAIRRCITNIQVEWNLGIPIENVPHQLSPAYIDDRLIVYGLTNNQTILLNPKSSIKIRTDHSYYHLGITNSDRIANNNQMIARLAAKALILELEHGKISRLGSKQMRFEDMNQYSDDDIKQRIIDLSLRYHILSPYTAFIGIEERVNNSNIHTVLREVPIQISSDSISRRPSWNKIETDLRKSRDQSTSNASTYCDRSVRARYKDNEHYLQSRAPLIREQSDDEMPRPKELTTTTRYYSSNLADDQQLHRYTDENDIGSRDDEDIVRCLINKQSKDGLLNFTSNEKTIKDLTGKSLAVFRSSETHSDTQILVTAIVIILLQSNFMDLQSVWNDAVEKARERLVNLLNNDWKKLMILFRNIRLILNG
jgi:hypothetical protein